MTQGALRILLVEDDPALGETIMSRLRRDAWIVDHVDCLADAFEAVMSSDYRAVLLDRRLPDGDGIGLIPAIKSRRFKAQVILLTARDAIDDRIEGLDSGADDYLVKPFDFGELSARLRAACRRGEAALPGDAPRVTSGRLSYAPGTREITVANEPVALPRRELALIEMLIRRSGRVVLREHIENEIFGIDADVSPNALETHISRLRRRLQDMDAGVELRTIRGVGYMLEPTR